MLIPFLLATAVLIGMIPWFMQQGIIFPGGRRGRRKFRFLRESIRPPGSCDPIVEFDATPGDELRSLEQPPPPSTSSRSDAE
ncbi:MAG: hypothetical protein JNM43_01805 [Planctomycetaceae bacterium]|nr:hypothetical protein [Planctomycetaceae bacterium]